MKCEAESCPRSFVGLPRSPSHQRTPGGGHQFLLLRGLAVQSAADRVEEQEHDAPRHTVEGVARGPASGNEVFPRVGLGCRRGLRDRTHVVLFLTQHQQDTQSRGIAEQPEARGYQSEEIVWITTWLRCRRPTSADSRLASASGFANPEEPKAVLPADGFAL